MQLESKLSKYHARFRSSPREVTWKRAMGIYSG